MRSISIVDQKRRIDMSSTLRPPGSYSPTPVTVMKDVPSSTSSAAASSSSAPVPSGAPAHTGGSLGLPTNEPSGDSAASLQQQILQLQNQEVGASPDKVQQIQKQQLALM